MQVGQRNAEVGSSVAANVFQSALRSQKEVNVIAVSDQKSVVFDEFLTNKYDVADMASLFRKSDKLGAALLTHVIQERLYDATNRTTAKPTLAGFGPAHASALQAENQVLGTSRREVRTGLFHGFFNTMDIRMNWVDDKGNVVHSYRHFEYPWQGSPAD